MIVVDRVIGLFSPPAALRRAIKLCEQNRLAEALPLLTVAARAGIPDAEFRMAQCYLQGAGVPRSQTEGARWLHRAASKGYTDAQCLLGALYVNGLASEPPDGARGKEVNSYNLFHSDPPIKPDFDAAIRWARQAAQAGSPRGQALLAFILSYGPESFRDLEEARQWYARSAAAGCPE